MRILIKNATVYNSADTVKCDIIIDNGKIENMQKGLPDTGIDTIIDAAGHAVMPGFVDMHCHLREPGYEYKEDILSGTTAAAAGGFTSVACMPNTDPVIDNAEIVDFVIKKAKSANMARVYPIAAATVGQNGEALTEYAELKRAGAIALSDDGKPVEGAAMMQNAMRYAKSHDMLIISHCEEMSLINGGVVNEGKNSTLAGLKGITRAAEEVMTARDIILAKHNNAKLHIAHVSTRGSVELVRRAKAGGVNVTCETCPHYFSITDELIHSYDADVKVNPPLRTPDDIKAVIDGLLDGTIDAIATDHAPHHRDEKLVEFSRAANGISGFETAFSVGYTYLVKPGIMDLNMLVRLMSYNPAKVLGINAGTVQKGADADIVIVNLNDEYTVDPSKFYSKGKNTPFKGSVLSGRVVKTICGGKVTFG